MTPSHTQAGARQMGKTGAARNVRERLFLFCTLEGSAYRAHFAPFVCHTTAGSRAEFRHHSSISWARITYNYRDLYPSDQTKRRPGDPGCSEEIETAQEPADSTSSPKLCCPSCGQPLLFQRAIQPTGRYPP